MLQGWRGIQDPIKTEAPNAPFVMLLASLLTVVFFTVALTPVWGLGLTLVLQFTFFMGFVNAGTFLPGGVLGSVLLYGVFVAAFFTSVLIPHEGLAHNTRG